MTADEDAVRARAEEAFHGYLDEVQAGRDPDPDAFLASQPAAVRSELRRILADYQELRRALGGLPADLEADRVLGDYRLLRELGRGGMGVIWEAEQLSLGRRVALKVLYPHLGLSPSTLERFQREAEAGGKLSHASIVAVHAVGASEGQHFIAQELVEGGRTLAHRLAELREHEELPPEYFRELALLLAAVAEALEVAHRSGVIHRDIKPSNILIAPDGSPKIADFGLARIQDELGRSRSGELVGTPFYMSPEQAGDRRAPIDHRTDVFSLGATLYEAMTLRRPFEGDTSQQVLAKIRQEYPPDPRRIRSRAPVDLAVVCFKAMEKSPERRYASMAALAEDLRRFVEHRAILARPVGPWGRALRWSRRHPARAVGGLAVAVLLAVVIGLGSYSAGAWKRAEEEHAGRVSAEQELRDRAVVDGLLDRFVDGTFALGAEGREERIASYLEVFREYGLPLEGDLDPNEITGAIAAARLRDPAVGAQLLESIGDLVGLLDLVAAGRAAELLAGTPPPWTTDPDRDAWRDLADRAPELVRLWGRLTAVMDHALQDPWRREVWRTAREDARLRRVSLPGLVTSDRLAGRSAREVIWLAGLLLASPGALEELSGWAPEVDRLLELTAQAEEVGELDVVAAHFYRATIAFYGGDNAAVLQHLRILRAVRRGSGVVQLLLAHQLGVAGELEEAARACALVVELSPELAARAHASLGDVLFAHGRFEEALVAFDRAVAAAPGSGLPRRLRGDALAELGRIDEAAAAYRAAIAADPELDSAYANLWLLLRRGGDPAGAGAVAEQAASRWPDSGWAHMGVGFARLSEGDPDGAVRALTRHAQLNAESARAQHNLATALRAAGRTREAVEALRRSVALEPGFLEGHAALVGLLLEEGDSEAAAEVARTAAAAVPGSPWALRAVETLEAAAEARAREAGAISGNDAGPSGANDLDRAAAGVWASSIGELVLHEREGEIRGLYRHQGMPCFLHGRRQGQRIELAYAELQETGEAWLEVAADGSSFTGARRASTAEEWIPWSGARPE